jgi:hypothetical protein
MHDETTPCEPKQRHKWGLFRPSSPVPRLPSYDHESQESLILWSFLVLGRTALAVFLF